MPQINSQYLFLPNSTIEGCSRNSKFIFYFFILLVIHQISMYHQVLLIGYYLLFLGVPPPVFKSTLLIFAFSFGFVPWEVLKCFISKLFLVFIFFLAIGYFFGTLDGLLLIGMTSQIMIRCINFSLLVDWFYKNVDPVTGPSTACKKVIIYSFIFTH
ncbi:hypothetical protein RhiirB3_487806 [Rhizophagus irregularis]|nr:hypothetical protein RhiirB3_487806 [Rhizophagus irregularis]